MNIDPLAEMYESWSPYNYVKNNPIAHTDPTGMSVDNEYDLNISTGQYTQVSNKGGNTTDYVNVKTGDGETIYSTSESVRTTSVNLRVGGEIPWSSTERLPGEIRTTTYKATSGALQDPSADIFMSYAGGKIAGLVVGAALRAVTGFFGKGATAAEGAAVTTAESSAAESPVTNQLYQRPNNATTAAQRASVQGQPCVDCGTSAPTMVANHKVPLVQEHYRTGTINTQNMRTLEAVNSQCPTCSAQQGAQMSQYSKQMKAIINGR